ncbi:putative nicotinamide n-methyltransferase nnt1 [Phaeomoniella chlamydospora]|uniref:Protein N-terminal and lysine N-methyltransferase EFM7 n=1 Tax=Phaeomoniella chlamydospora TaxID=158046 RepID=A0A0G2EYK9_PHACM|nr:putative nicotinamide n-methyltransferase nnt1 [Phaeomoniella chlamydospora]
MLSDDEENDSLGGDLFQEPEGFYQPEKPATYADHMLKSGQTLKLRLHEKGHLLWNAGRTIANFLEDHREELVKDKTVLELGAGAGLPSLTCAIYRARQVVVTDYPDPELIANLRENIESCELLPEPPNIYAEGYLWGASTEALTRHLSPSDEARFDLLILADLLFNHSEHQKLAATITKTLKKTPAAQALVFFTPYRPWLYEKDLAFFDLAKAQGLVVTRILEHAMEKVMFENDPGDEMLRRTVFGFRLTWSNP